MKPRHLLSKIDSDRVVNAIADVENHTSGEIRVVISHVSRIKNAQKFAVREFHRLKMNRTRERNAVLVFIAPVVRQFAVIGDEGIHKKCGEKLWKEAVEKIEGHFRSEQFTEGLVHAIALIGEALKRHFPRHPDDRNKISNEIVER